MAVKKSTGKKKSLAKGRPTPFYTKAGYNTNKKRFDGGGKIKKGSS